MKAWLIPCSLASLVVVCDGRAAILGDRHGNNGYDELDTHSGAVSVTTAPTAVPTPSPTKTPTTPAVPTTTATTTTATPTLAPTPVDRIIEANEPDGTATDIIDTDIDGTNGLNSTGIIGIAVGSGVLIFAALLVAQRRTRRGDDENNGANNV